MRILGQPVSSIYIWAIALLSALAVISSYTLHVFPIALIFAVAASGTIEILIRKYYLKHPFKMPYSGLITGLIIGSVAPINASILLVVIASLIAAVSKFFIQYRSTNIFNPASLGLLMALPLFGIDSEWWAAGGYNLHGIAISLAPILIMLAYEARRMPAALSFVAASLLLAAAAAGLQALSLYGVSALAFSVNYYFAFVMLIEPKTSPHGTYAQLAYGSALAMLYTALAYSRFTYPFLAALLLGNIAYAIYRYLSRRGAAVAAENAVAAQVGAA
jgi:Na+-transporting NADH:ubiquinone oxidoreductase subunit NqrB